MAEAETFGGCRCGAIRYRLASPPIFVNCCHCRDCQRLAGSAFALNAMIEADRVVVVRGAPSVDADGSARCAQCAVTLWATHPMFGPGIFFLRVGTLDAGERIAPDAHFFVRSKHPWVTLPSGARTFATLPGPDDPPLFDAAAQARVAAAVRA